MLDEAPLSIRPKGLPAIISQRWVEQGLLTVLQAKERGDYASADFIKRSISEFVEVQERRDGTVAWSWKPLQPGSRYWDA